MNPDLIALGDNIKVLEKRGTLVTVGGYLVRFGDPQTSDLTGDFFTPDTNFGVEFPASSKTWFNHRLPVVYQDENKQARAVALERELKNAEMTRDEFGIFCRGVLDERDEYEKFLLELSEQGKLGWSSGTAAHLVKRTPVDDDKYRIDQWLLGLDASYTHMPAEWRNSVVPLKSFLESQQAEKQDARRASSTRATIVSNQPIQTEVRMKVIKSIKARGIVENNDRYCIYDMDENGNAVGDAIVCFDTFDEAQAALESKAHPAPRAENTPLESKFAAFSAKVDAFMQQMLDAPAIRNAGYFTQDGGAADKHVKSFGDFLMAVKRNDAKRLREIYGSVKTLNEGQGESGGYLVPTAYSTELLQVANTASPILGLVRSIPVETDAGEWPVLDQYAAPTAGGGNTAMAAAVAAATRAEAGTYTETEPDFEMLKWRVHSISGITPVSKELNADSPQAIEALLTTLFGIAIGTKKEYYILRGNGAGQPLGILNSAAAIGVSPATNNAFSFVDAMTMISRFKKITNNVRWVYHPSIIPDFAGASWVQGDLPIKLTDVGYGEGVTSEHLPQADNSGAVLLADFGAYLLFERGGIEIAFSEHAYFTSGRVAWRFDQRLDGQPWMKNAITLADPQGSFTISPFVYHND